MIDLIPNGSSHEEVVILAKKLGMAGVNIINTGIGWHEAQFQLLPRRYPQQQPLGYQKINGKN